MRLGLVGPLPPPFGGMGNQLRQLYRLLSEEEGIEVTVVQTNGEYWPRFMGKARGIRTFFRLLPYVTRLWRMTGQVDIVHVFANSGWSWQLFAAPAIWIAALRGVPSIVNYRGGEAESYLRRSIGRVRPSMRRASAIVVPSGFLQAVFSRFGIEARVIPNIVDLDRFYPSEVPPTGAPHLVIARNLEPIYGIETAIRAMPPLVEEFPGIRLSIAGSGPQETELKSLVARLGLEDAVRFTGRLSPDQIAATYRSAHILLNPTTVDNMPNSLLEAMASGLPIVTTNVGGIPYVVEDGVTALFVRPGDSEAMAGRVRDLLTDDALPGRLVQKGLRTVRQYAWPEVREKWLGLYAEMAADKTLKGGQDSGSRV